MEVLRSIAPDQSRISCYSPLDALGEGYEVYPVVDAVGGTSPEAHRAALERVTTTRTW